MQSPDVITFQLMGGLGNQLFQYTAAASYSRKTGGFVSLDLSQCRKPFNSRNSLLTDLKLPFDIPFIPSRDRSRVATKFKTIAFQSGIFKGREGSIEDVYTSKVLGYDPKLYECSDSRVVGFFQSYKYLEDLPESFRNIEVAGVTSWQTATAKEINEKTLVIHIRRGDYEILKDSFGLLSSNYYKNSIEVALSHFTPKNIICFSDNISTAKELLASLNLDIKFVCKPEREPDASSLYLMSLSGAIVIANSSFSWWAATLNQRKIVVAPKDWFRTTVPPNDLMPSQWLRCPSDWIDR